MSWYGLTTNAIFCWAGVLGPDWPVLVPVVDLDKDANSNTNDVGVTDSVSVQQSSGKSKFRYIEGLMYAQNEFLGSIS